MFTMRNYYIFRLIVFTAISVLIGVFAHDIIAYLHYLVGGVMLIYGFEGILFTVARVKRGFYKDYQFFLGCMELLLGTVMMALIRDFNIICVMWGTWTIVRESFELYETSHKFLHKFPAILSLALSIIEIVFSILLILHASHHHALTHIYLLIPELIINALSPLLFEIHLKRRGHKEKSDSQE